MQPSIDISPFGWALIIPVIIIFIVAIIKPFR